MNRCILCGKCVRICDEIVSFGALTFIGRGIETKIGCEFDEALNCEFCGSCVSVCPVGALLARPFKFKARFWAMEKKRSICGYCGTGCNLTLGVKEGKVLTTVYDENQGFHRGQLCVRGRFGYQFINNEKRLKKPLIRKNGALVECGWDEALQLAASKIRNGSETAAIATPRLTNEEFFLFRKLMKGIGSENFDHAAGYAHKALTSGFARSLGSAASTAMVNDIQKSDMLLVIKTDSYETHPVIGFEINIAVKDKGVKLNIVSDKNGKLGKLPGARTFVHLPGSETLLINALCSSVIKQKLVSSTAASLPDFKEYAKGIEAFSPEKAASLCGISPEEINSLAADFASSKKAMILFPTGVAYPGHDSELATALANLAILAGKVEGEGCGLLCLPEKNNSQGAVDTGFYPTGKGLDALSVFDAIEDGRIKTLFLAGENPVVSYPDEARIKRALEKLDFLVLTTLFPTETAEYADLVLPASSYAEKEGTFTSAGGHVQYFAPVIPKAGDSRTDFEIISSLIKLTGGEAASNPSEIFAEIASTLDGYAGMTYENLGENGAFTAVKTRPALILPQTQAPALRKPEEFSLVTGALLYHNGTLSQFGEGPMHVSPESYAEISRKDASRLGIKENDTITLTSDSGSMQLAARVSLRIPEGVVFIPNHFSANPVNAIWSGKPVTPVALSR